MRVPLARFDVAAPTHPPTLYSINTGFLILPGFADAATLHQLRQAATDRLHSLDAASIAAAASFCFGAAKGGAARAAAPHFLESAATAAPFLEADAVDEASGQLKPGVDPAAAVNKIGHALHDVDPTFRSFSRSPALASIFRSLNYARPLPVQSMLICKSARVGGEVVPHQDSAFLWTVPRPTVVGCWLALDDADEGNGCLFAVPGSHVAVPVPDRFVRSQQADGVHVGFSKKTPPAYDTAGAVPLPARAGTLVLLHGGVVHFSAPNASGRPRSAFTLHVVEGGGGVAWADDNWLQRPAGQPFVALYE